MPEICRDRRPEHARGIHGCAGKRTSEQDVERDGRSDHQAGHAPRPALIDGSAMKDEYEEERKNGFHQDPLRPRKINRQLGSAGHDHIPSEQTEAN